MAYTQARKTRTKGTRYVGFYRDLEGNLKATGRFDDEDEAPGA